MSRNKALNSGKSRKANVFTDTLSAEATSWCEKGIEGSDNLSIFLLLQN
jgi:hypothetical protein